jgi:hypothetical protein
MPKPEKKPEVLQDDALRALLLPIIDHECKKRELTLDTAGRAEVIDMIKEHALRGVKATVKLVFEVAIDIDDEDDDDDDDDSDIDIDSDEEDGDD